MDLELYAELYQQIMHYVDTLTCTADSKWEYTIVAKDKLGEVEYIPYSRKNDLTSLGALLSKYNYLKLRILNEIGGEYVRNDKQVAGIDCVNAKPVIRFKD